MPVGQISQYLMNLAHFGRGGNGKWMVVCYRFSIIGLYISVILVIGQFVRMNTTGMVAGIMWEELPCVNKVWRLCQDIYMCREGKEFELEEELVAKLTFLYRSPETMIKVTRPPKED